jgi:hypothetical protein
VAQLKREQSLWPEFGWMQICASFQRDNLQRLSEFESYHLSHAVRSPPSPCTGRAASHGPAPWLPGRRERRIEARAGALHNEHVDAVVSSIERPLNARFSQATSRLNHRGIELLAHLIDHSSRRH